MKNRRVKIIFNTHKILKIKTKTVLSKKMNSFYLVSYFIEEIKKSFLLQAVENGDL